MAANYSTCTPGQIHQTEPTDKALNGDFFCVLLVMSPFITTAVNYVWNTAQHIQPGFGIKLQCKAKCF